VGAFEGDFEGVRLGLRVGETEVLWLNQSAPYALSVTITVVPWT
jgi:hypothetical protein